MIRIKYPVFGLTIGLALCGGSLATAAAPGPLAPAGVSYASTEVGSRLPSQDINPEAFTGRSLKQSVHASRFMVSTANPLASRAAYDILNRGGSAVDAAIAAQMVLNVVEPQSSGIGGGGFMLTYDDASDRLDAYDGRETAPSATSSDRFMRAGVAMAFPDAVNSGLSVGAPGLLKMLELAHREHGVLPWSDLFQPAIRIAEGGFAVSPRLHALLDQNQALRAQPEAARYFYLRDGQPLPVGYWLVNLQLGQVFRAIAAEGSQAFYHGPIATDIVAAVKRHAKPGDLSVDDLAAYRALRREPVCAPLRQYKLCGAPPPSSGPLAIIQMLKMLEATPIRSLRPNSIEAIHYFSEAGRLAYADRDYYVADPAFNRVPVKALLDDGYLKERAAMIQSDRSMGKAAPGNPAKLLSHRGRDDSPELDSTTHISIIDARGNVVSTTTSIESAFGSKILVRGFLLNNQLTDFSLSNVDTQGKPVINRVEAGKRPRSAMAPMVVFKEGEPYIAIGSPGGSAIINYVAKSLVGVLDWNLPLQEAIDLPNMGSRNGPTEIERGTTLQRTEGGLEALGHAVQEVDFPSGLQAVMRAPDGSLIGAADPRREGRALGR